MSRPTRCSRRFLVAACCLGCLVAAPVRADSPLSFIPEDAAFVLRFKSPDAMVQRAAKWFPAQMQEVPQQTLSELIGGIDVRRSQDWWVVTFLSKGTDAASAFILKTTDLKSAKKEHPGSTHIVINDWQVFVDSNETAEHLKGCRWGRLKSLATAMDPTSRQLFEKGDVAMFVNAPKLRAFYRPVLEVQKKSVWESIQQAARPTAQAAGPPPPGQKPGQPAVDNMLAVSDPKTYEGLANIWHGILHLIEETETVTVGLTVDDKGAELQAYVAVAPNSPTAQFFARHPASEMKTLGHLPSSALAYFGFSGELNEFSRWIGQLSVSSLDRPLAQRQIIEQKLQSLPLERIAGYYGSIELAEDLGPPLLVSSAIETQQPQQVRKFKSAVIELTNTARETKAGAIQPATVQQNAETIARRPVDLAVMQVPKDLIPTNFEFLETRWGTNTSYETRLAAVPGLVLQSTGGGRPAMLSLLHNLESQAGAATQPGWRSTRARCGPRANFVCLVDLGRCAFAVAKAVMVPAIIAADPAERAALQKMQTNALELFRTREATYSGMAVIFEPHTLRFRLYIPREQVSEVFELYQLATEEFAAPAPVPKSSKAVPEE